jgi:metal-responsive CopG/Arc/MetJ family transcriptional regulator
MISDDRAMRTLVDIPEPQIRALDDASRREKRSRAALIRQAIDEYLAKDGETCDDDAFGILRGGEDGLAYQKRMRDEW